MLTEAQLAARKGKITGSVVKTLCTGSETDINALWRRLVYDEPEEDLSGVWAVRLGEETERLNLEWYECKTGNTLTRHGEVVVYPPEPWAACTLDAFDEAIGGPIDAKHVGGFEKRQAIIERYWPQMTWQMVCTGTTTSRLSIIEGAREPVIETIDLDEDYATDLLSRARAFWSCVESKTPPFDLPPAPVAVLSEEMREIDLDSFVTFDLEESTYQANEGAPNWALPMAGALVQWGMWKPYLDRFEASKKEVKELLPRDVRKLTFDRITITRAKNGAMTIKESV